MRFREKLLRFFSGRYGIDQLWYGLLVLYFLLAILEVVMSFLLHGLPAILVQVLLNLLMWGVLALGVFRSFSRNLYKRSRENEIFLKFWNPVKSFFLLQRNKWKDRKTHVYRKCPDKNCAVTLRLAKKPGIHTVRCPKCGKAFQTRI